MEGRLYPYLPVASLENCLTKSSNKDPPKQRKQFCKISGMFLNSKSTIHFSAKKGNPLQYQEPTLSAYDNCTTKKETTQNNIQEPLFKAVLECSSWPNQQRSFAKEISSTNFKESESKSSRTRAVDTDGYKNGSLLRGCLKNIIRHTFVIQL